MTLTSTSPQFEHGKVHIRSGPVLEGSSPRGDLTGERPSLTETEYANLMESNDDNEHSKSHDKMPICTNCLESIQKPVVPLSEERANEVAVKLVATEDFDHSDPSYRDDMEGDYMDESTTRISPCNAAVPHVFHLGCIREHFFHDRDTEIVSCPNCCTKIYNGQGSTTRLWDSNFVQYERFGEFFERNINEEEDYDSEDGYQAEGEHYARELQLLHDMVHEALEVSQTPHDTISEAAGTADQDLENMIAQAFQERQNLNSMFRQALQTARNLDSTPEADQIYEAREALAEVGLDLENMISQAFQARQHLTSMIPQALQAARNLDSTLGADQGLNNINFDLLEPDEDSDMKKESNEDQESDAEELWLTEEGGLWLTEE